MATQIMDTEQVTWIINQMEKDRVIHELMTFHGRFELDFTQDYLNTLPVERLRHILLAVRLNEMRLL